MIAILVEFTKRSAAFGKRHRRSLSRSISYGSSEGSSSKKLVRFFSFEQAQYSIFISHFRDEAGTDARLLYTLLNQQKAVKRPVFLDATDADDIKKILNVGVVNSDVLLLVQTKNVLTRPWCLLELYTAVRNNVPVLPLVVEGGGYDFHQARMLLGRLETALEEANPGATQTLRELLADGVVPVPPNTEPPSISDMSARLSTTIPFLISGQYDPAASDKQHEASMQDIVQRHLRAIKAEARRRSSLVGAPHATQREGSASPPPIAIEPHKRGTSDARLVGHGGQEDLIISMGEPSSGIRPEISQGRSSKGNENEEVWDGQEWSVRTVSTLASPSYKSTDVPLPPHRRFVNKLSAPVSSRRQAPTRDEW